jgi:thymidine kinase
MPEVVLRWLSNKVGCEDAAAGRPSEACLTSFASIAKVRCRGEAEAHREDWYLCPARLDVLLTVAEFATELVLICKQCNNDAGRHFDAEAKKQQR